MNKKYLFIGKIGKVLLLIPLLILTVFSGITFAEKPTLKHYGDMNADGVISQSDIELILKIASGQSESIDTSYIQRADVNGDGIIDASDAKIAAKYMKHSVTMVEDVMPEETTTSLIGQNISAENMNGDIVQVFDSQSAYSVISNEKMYIYPDLSQVMQVRDAFVIVTFGWGHGVGMSQQGAIGLARAGYSYIQIIQHYYKNVAIMKEQYPSTVKCSGKNVDTVEMLARIVQMEIAGCTNKNDPLDMNALRAQAVAAYTNLKYCNYSVSGCSYVSSYSSCRDDVKQVAKEIAGQFIQYNGNVVYAYYAACSGGVAATYEQIWGSTSHDMSYLTNCASYYDCYTSDYITATAYSPTSIKDYILSYDSSIVLSDDPSQWIKILVHDDAVNENIGYVSSMQIGNKTILQGAGLKFRDNIMKYDIKSPCFAIIYNGEYL